jgi:predicted Zn-dependent protease
MAAKETGGRPPKFLSTHPPSQERIANLQRLAPGLMPVYEQARANQALGGAPAAPKSPPAAPTPAKPAATEQEELKRFLGR